MNIQWYPGHMAKARKLVEKNLKLVDVVIELLDARAPVSSRNPMMNKIVGTKPRLVILNKADLADKNLTGTWIRKICPDGIALAIDSRRGHGITRVPDAVLRLARPQIRSTTVGRARPVRCMIVGIPNVGKSLFINRLVRQKVTRTGNKPGVTRGEQWIRVSKRVELLDTPGILWPKFEDPEIGFRLAAIGAIREEVYPPEEVAAKLIDWLQKNYPEALQRRYDLPFYGTPVEIMEHVAQKRGFVLSGGKIDIHKTSIHILKEFRDGKLGRFTLDLPAEQKMPQKLLDLSRDLSLNREKNQ